MKRNTLLIITLISLLILTALPALAEQELLVTATVTASRELAIAAPHSGELGPYTLKPGDAVKAGESLFNIAAQNVYAQVDGSIAAIYAKEGQDASGAVSRYGAVLQIEHKDRWELRCNASTGYNSADNRDLRVGTPVYLRSSNEEHFAQGEITQVDGLNFIVAIYGGDLKFNEEVKVYRDEDYENKTLLARAKPSPLAAHAVQASGTIVDMAVEAGDEVSEGDLLFSFVPETLSPQDREHPGLVSAPEDLVIASILATPGSPVQKGQPLCTGYPQGSMQLTALVAEKDLHQFTDDADILVSFEELGLEPIEGKLAYCSSKGEGEESALFPVYISLDPPQEVRFGMHATISLSGSEK